MHKQMIFFIVLILLICINCERWDGEVHWIFEWKIHSKIDSSNVGNIDYTWEIAGDSKNYRVREKCHYDSLIYQSFLITEKEKENIISDNLRVHLLIFNDNSKLLDTTLFWNEMDFKTQESDRFHANLMNLSKKTIYIDYESKN